MLVEYRLRIRNAANSADALEVTSVRGGTNPYISEPPTGDGATLNPISGKVTSGMFTGRIVDPITSGTSRLFTSLLEDAGGRQQLGHRRAYWEFREDGGAWQTLYAGRVQAIRLVSGIEWSVTIGDWMLAEHEFTAFDPHEDDSFADYLTRWPNRGCLLGGPIRGGGFLTVPDLGGWQFRIAAQGGVTGYTYTRFDFVSGYDSLGQPIRNSERLNQVRAVINDAAQPFWQPVFATGRLGSFPGLAILVNGTAYESAKFVADPAGYRQARELLSLSLTAGAPSGCSFWLPGTVGSVGGVVRVDIISRKATPQSPVYWTGHPVDFLAALWAEAGIPYSSTALETVRDTIGAGARISLQLDAPRKIGALAEEAVYGPFGIGARAGTDGEIEIFCSRIFSNTAPVTEITSADVFLDETEAFDLDTSEAIRTVVFEHQRLVQPTRLNNLGDPYPDPDQVAALVRQPERFERSNDDAGAIGTGEVAYSVPGMVHFAETNDIDLAKWVDGRAHEIFDRDGRGPIRAKTVIRRGSAAAAKKLGDEVLLNLPQVPKANKRLGDDGAVSARAMQIVHLTPTLRGNEVELRDSGPNAQPVATVPTHTIAKSTGAPRAVADLTITNAATLNAASIAVRVQVAVTSGAVPAAEDYTDVLYFRAGEVPTTAFQLPPVYANKTVYARARSEQRGFRPSNWSTGVSVALDPLDAPTGLTATPSGSDGSQCDLTWTVGADAAHAAVQVFLRLNGEAFSAAILIEALPPGSAYYRIENLTPGATYIATVRHLDEVTGDLSATAEVTFIAGATVISLTAPTYADAFSVPLGAPGRVFGVRLGNLGVRYGIAVVAQHFPGEVEIAEAVETAVGAGTYGSYNTVGRVSSVSGDWTVWSRFTSNDRLKRKLKARHVLLKLDGTVGVASTYSDEVVVDPTTHDPIAPYPVGAPTALITRSSRNRHTEVLTLDGALGNNDAGPLSWRYKVGAAAYSAPSTAALPTTISVTVQSGYAVSVDLEVTQGDGQVANYPYSVSPRLEDGAPTRGEDDRRGGPGGVPTARGRIPNEDQYDATGATPYLDADLGRVTADLRGPSGTWGMDVVETGGGRGYGGFTSDTGDLVTTAKDSRAALLNVHFRYGTDGPDGVVESATKGFFHPSYRDSSRRPIAIRNETLTRDVAANDLDVGQERARGGFTSSTGDLVSTAKDSRAALLNAMFRHGVDDASGVVETAGLGFIHPDYTDASRRVDVIRDNTAGADVGSNDINVGQQRARGGFSNATGALVATAVDSRAALLNAHFRYGTDGPAGVVESASQAFVHPDYTDASRRPDVLYNPTLTRNVGANDIDVGQERSRGGFTSATGDLVSTAKDSRAALLNTMGRLNTDTVDNWLDSVNYAKTTPNQVTGAGRAYTGLDSSAKLVTGVTAAATGSDGYASILGRGGVILKATAMGGAGRGIVEDGVTRRGDGGMSVPSGFIPATGAYSADGTTALIDPDLDAITTDLKDPNGRALFGGRMRCKLLITTDPSISHNSVTTLSFDDENVDVGGLHAAGSPSRITIPTGGNVGVWRITAWVMFDSNATGRRFARFLLNGTDVVAIATAAPVNGDVTTLFLEYEAVAPSVGDYYEVQVYQNSGGGLNVIGSSLLSNTRFAATHLA